MEDECIEVLKLTEDFLDRHNAEFANTKELCICCHSNSFNGVRGIIHEQWCPIQRARELIAKEKRRNNETS